MAIATSPFSTYYDLVQKLYVAYYRRPAEPNGMLFWAKDIVKYNNDETQILSSFLLADEALKVIFGTVTNANIAAVVDWIYQSAFGRQPREVEDGRSYWINEFTSGRQSAGKLLLSIINAARGGDIIALNNRCWVAHVITQYISSYVYTDPTFETGGNRGAPAYDGVQATARVRDYINLITSDPRTVPTKAEIEQFAAYWKT